METAPPEPSQKVLSSIIRAQEPSNSGNSTAKDTACDLDLTSNTPWGGRFSSMAVSGSDSILARLRSARYPVLDTVAKYDNFQKYGLSLV